MRREVMKYYNKLTFSLLSRYELSIGQVGFNFIYKMTVEIVRAERNSKGSTIYHWSIEGPLF